MKPLGLFVLACFFNSSVLAGLQWGNTRIEVFPKPGDTSSTAEFEFKNVGRDSVTIASLEAACGCTTAVLEKKIYQPGEKGRITAVFSFGDRTGLQTKTIQVSIEGKKEKTLLTMSTHIPDLLKVSPQFLLWKTGEAPLAQTIELTALPKTPVRVTKVTSSDPSIKVMLLTVKEDALYKVVVTPTQTSAPVSALLTVETAFGPDVHHLFSAYAHVKPSTSPQSEVLVYENGERASVGVGK